INRMVFVLIFLVGLAIWSLIVAARKESVSTLQRFRRFVPGVGLLTMAIILGLMTMGRFSRVNEPWFLLGLGVAGLLTAYDSDKSFRIQLLIASGGCILVALRLWCG